MSDIPATMTAVEVATPGPPESLRAVSRPVPQPGPREVLIRVAAAGVNRPDVLQRRGAYPPPPGVTDIPGLEVAGEVVRAGSGVTDPVVGARVCALVAGGGYAEYVAAPAQQCLPVPEPLSMEEAAALPETFFTVYYNVFIRARLRPGETLLIHGGASGIGTTAILLAKAFAARVIITAEMRRNVRLAARWVPTWRSTTSRKISLPARSSQRAGRGPMSSSTWSAASIWRAIWRRRQ